MPNEEVISGVRASPVILGGDITPNVIKNIREASKMAAGKGLSNSDVAHIYNMIFAKNKNDASLASLKEAYRGVAITQNMVSQWYKSLTGKEMAATIDDLSAKAGQTTAEQAKKTAQAAGASTMAATMPQAKKMATSFARSTVSNITSGMVDGVMGTVGRVTAGGTTFTGSPRVAVDKNVQVADILNFKRLLVKWWGADRTSKGNGITVYDLDLFYGANSQLADNPDNITLDRAADIGKNRGTVSAADIKKFIALLSYGKRVATPAPPPDNSKQASGPVASISRVAPGVTKQDVTALQASINSAIADPNKKIIQDGLLGKNTLDMILPILKMISEKRPDLKIDYTRYESELNSIYNRQMKMTKEYMSGIASLLNEYVGSVKQRPSLKATPEQIEQTLQKIRNNEVTDEDIARIKTDNPSMVTSIEQAVDDREKMLAEEDKKNSQPKADTITRNPVQDVASNSNYSVVPEYSGGGIGIRRASAIIGGRAMDAVTGGNDYSDVITYDESLDAEEKQDLARQGTLSKKGDAYFKKPIPHAADVSDKKIDQKTAISNEEAVIDTASDGAPRNLIRNILDTFDFN